MNLEKMLNKMEVKFGTVGLRGYYKKYLGEAIDIYNGGGSLFDLDNIVHLIDILGFDVSYKLMQYIDRNLCENSSILELTDEDYDRIMEVCVDYMEDKD